MHQRTRQPAVLMAVRDDLSRFLWRSSIPAFPLVDSESTLVYNGTSSRLSSRSGLHE